ncbi:MAG: CehA/McbA family metallohydrolase [Planctomycetaceae bacterium]|nr:CehA/McbA family metallohydrolase [Planctomycetaceae bacterium]
MTMPCLLSLLLATCGADVATTTVVSELRHLRSGPVREWSEFPEATQETRLEVTFTAKSNASEWALFLRQQDVKQIWQVQLNGQKLGELTRDENDMLVGFPVPTELLRDGDNHLQIAARSSDAALSDDIRVGSIRLEQRPLREALTEAVLDIDVRDVATQQGLPCRITVLNADGALPMLGTPSSEQIATRPGLAYLADGRGRLQLPAGRYTVYAGRGFEYSLARQEIAVAAGETAQVALTLQREVSTEGYVACDTHVHTLTHSGHGDATIEERMLTIAGEGIELPIATDHNLHIDYEALAQKLHVRQYFTPVTGNEVTTGRGHFNVFPVQAGATPPNHRLGTWPELFEEIVRRTDPAVIVLNHAQDLHSGIRPFGPKLFNAAVAEHQEAWPERLNAMEVVNSGATQTDPLQLFHNWMALLNRGRTVTPIGSSDSHDVGRHFVGQARTYVRCDDRDPGRIPVAEAIDSLRHGRVLVSYGLLTELVVNDRFRSGDLAPMRDQPCRTTIRVLGPHWVQARQLLLYANGQMIREVAIPPDSRTDSSTGVLWSEEWELPQFAHDVHLVAIAVGPGLEQPYWRTAKPYQPVSLDGSTHVIGCSGAVWLDVDGDGRPTSARDYAERIFADATGDVTKQLAALSRYDAAVAAHVAHLQDRAGLSPVSEEMQRAWRTASPAARTGFQNYVAAWRECELARRSSTGENQKAP